MKKEQKKQHNKEFLSTVCVIDSGVDEKSLRKKGIEVESYELDKDVKKKVTRILRCSDSQQDPLEHGQNIAHIISTVVPRVHVISVKVFKKRLKCSFADIFLALDYALTHFKTCRVINLSLSHDGTNELGQGLLAGLVEKARRFNKILIAPQGNTAGAVALSEQDIILADIDKRKKHRRKRSANTIVVSRKILARTATKRFTDFYHTSYATAYLSGLVVKMLQKHPKWGTHECLEELRRLKLQA